MLFSDGAYVGAESGLFFRRVKPPKAAEMETLIHRVSHRVGRYLERGRLLVRHMEDRHLTLDTEDDAAMDDLMGHSVSYRIAVDPHRGRKAFTLHALPQRSDEGDDARRTKSAGVSLHTGSPRLFPLPLERLGWEPFTS